ncbi:recombinase zinc beta ribbon domain-containing protein [Actinomadura sp. NBRC 104412]|uniref:zinc ribbon domain-containing protein n=1 Tax=Actinomadura sp. NBRC 104412 TaxID=3032203 RepID=UPI003326397E
MRSTADERRRVHHHYLKGSLFCGSCKARNMKRRMVLQLTTNRHGTTYQYFFCTGKKHHNCPMPHISVMRLEEMVEEHYTTIRFAPQFIADARDILTGLLNEDRASLRLLHQQLTAELEALDAKEENLLDLAADDELPTGKIKARLRDIERRRQHLTERLSHTSDDLEHSARLIDLALTLLTDPQGAYLRSDDHQRRLMNQGIFQALYVEEDTITSQLREPFASLHAVQATWVDEPQETTNTAHVSQPSTDNKGAAADQRPPESLLGAATAATDDDGMDAHQGADTPRDSRRSLPLTGKGSSWVNTLQVLLGGTWVAPGSNRASVVGDTGFEPVTSSV